MNGSAGFEGSICAAQEQSYSSTVSYCKVNEPIGVDVAYGDRRRTGSCGIGSAGRKCAKPFAPEDGDRIAVEAAHYQIWDGVTVQIGGQKHAAGVVAISGGKEPILLVQVYGDDVFGSAQRNGNVGPSIAAEVTNSYPAYNNVPRGDKKGIQQDKSPVANAARDEETRTGPVPLQIDEVGNPIPVYVGDRKAQYVIGGDGFCCKGPVAVVDQGPQSALAGDEIHAPIAVQVRGNWRRVGDISRTAQHLRGCEVDGWRGLRCCGCNRQNCERPRQQGQKDTLLIQHEEGSQFRGRRWRVASRTENVWPADSPPVPRQGSHINSGWLYRQSRSKMLAGCTAWGFDVGDSETVVRPA